MNLEEANKLIKKDNVTGVVKHISSMKGKESTRIDIYVIEMCKGGFITILDDGVSNVRVEDSFNVGDKIKLSIDDSIISWHLENKIRSYFVPYSIDTKQTSKKILDLPEIRVYLSDGGYKSFTYFETACNFSKANGLDTPVVAFKGLEVDLWDIREDN